MGLSSEFSSLLKITQVEWREQRAARAEARGEPGEALNHLLVIARHAASEGVGEAAWTELLTRATRMGVAAGDRGVLAELVEQYATVAWPEGQGVAELAGATAGALEPDQLDAARALGAALARAYPAHPLGHALWGHFDELLALSEGDLTPARARARADRFTRALALAERAGDDALARRCALRAGASLMLGGVDTTEGRRLMRGVEARELTADELLWYAVGMSRSGFWLDRVRAADAIDGLVEARATARPGSPDVAPDTLEAMTRWLLTQDVFALQPAEEDRLAALVETALPPGARERASQTLALRAQADRARDTALSDSGEFAAALAERADQLGGAWRDASLAFDALRHRADGDPALPLPARPWLAFARHADALLAAHADDDLDALVAALGAVHADLTADAPTGASPRPLAVAWPALLKRLSARARDDDEATRQDALRDALRPALTRWAEVSSAPGYGWWLLAAHTLRAKLPGAAAALATRAVRGQSEADPAVRDFVVGRLTAWAIDGGDHAVMLKWLSVGESYAAR
jgi:hypothetical protein